ncbi:MAG: hypothetical protein CME66_09290 [Halobacteriovoraceae bacterium]|nr:hypothetical protein [Halobacteriovoraceae bacterium]|tara:strand:+ start:680 stop:1594 length:915 start_codon:yes stop_codon:yes gene_type:complete
MNISLPQTPPFFYFLLGWIAVDGSHFFSTIFVTYLDKDIRQRLKAQLIIIPFVLIVGASTLNFFGYKNIFILILGLSAAYHFIRQESGWMKIASRLDSKAPSWLQKIDILTSYCMTILPLAWTIRMSNNGHWYEKGDLIYLPDHISELLIQLFWPVIIVFILSNIYHCYQTKIFNLSKLYVFINTLMGWYIPRVILENPYLSVALITLHHGVPYFFIVFKHERISQNSKVFNKLKKYKYILFYLASVSLYFAFYYIMFVLPAFISFKNFNNFTQSVAYGILIAPLMTHFLLDSYIWKRKYRLIS